MKDPLKELERQRQEEEEAQRGTLQNAFRDFGYVTMPSEAVAPILDVNTRRALSEWMAEMNSKAALQAVNVKPRTRVLLDGPPGVGKTTLGHHVAARLGLPMVTVMANAIVSKWVGDGARNIGKLFRTARACPNGVVLFIDEFDALARARGTRHSHSENEGNTIALLAELDRHEGMVFAATNQEDVIDPAVQRRFNLRINIGLPGPKEMRAIVKLYLRPLDVPDSIIAAIADELEGGSPALAKDMCEAIKRGLVLGEELKLDRGLGALIRRATDTIKPHADMVIPKLWGGIRESVERLDAAADGEWPPALPAPKGKGQEPELID